MVWGLSIKTPYLYNIGVEPLNGDFGQVDVIDRTPDGGVLPGGMVAGRPVRTEHMPTIMRWISKRKIPDFQNSFCINVSQRAKDVIEGLEPEVHQFVPVEYRAKAEKFVEQRYFLVACNRLDSLDHGKTTMVFLSDRHGSYWRPVYDLVCAGQLDLIPPHLSPDTKSKLVFNRAQIGAAHMWVDKYLLAGGPFISDALAGAFTASGLTGLGLSEKGLETV